MNTIKSRLPLIIIFAILLILLAAIHLWLNNKPENEILILWGHMEIVLIRTTLMAVYSGIFTLLILLFIKSRILTVFLLCIPLLVTGLVYVYYKDVFPTYIHNLNIDPSIEEHYLAVIHFQRPNRWNDQLVFYEKVAPNRYVVIQKHQFKIGHQVAQLLKDNSYQIEDNPLRIVIEDSTYQINNID